MSTHRGHSKQRALLRRTDRAQRGSALLLALVFMLVFSIILAAITTYATTNSIASKKLIAQRSKGYSADGTLDAAINWAKDTPNVGRDPDLYPSDPPCVYKKPAEGVIPAITVSCDSPPGSGSGRGPAGGAYPPNAILTLGQRTAIQQNGANGNFTNCSGGAEDGIRTLKYGLPSGVTCDTSKATTGPMSIRGDVRSNSTIKVDGSQIETWPKQNGTETKAYSVLACNGVNARSATSTASSNGCAGVPASGTMADPNYTHRPIVASAGSVPAACASTGVTAIAPGTFSSAKALSDLVNSNSCKDKYIWFQPGVYYFNFTDTANQLGKCSGTASNQYQTSLTFSRHEWCIGRGTTGASVNPHIVGGTPFNWDGITPPTAATAFPQDIDEDNLFGGNCDPDKPGVQFIFGGDSRVYVADGTFELCAGPDPANVNAPRIAVYGLKAQNVVTTSSLVGLACPPPPAVWPAGSGDRPKCTTNASQGGTIDGNLATQKYLDGCTNPLNLFTFWFSNEAFENCLSKSSPIRVNFNGYSVPPGNEIQSVVLRVAYNTNANSDPVLGILNFGACEPGTFSNQLVTFLGLPDKVCVRPSYNIVGGDGPSACQNQTKLPATTRLSTFAVDITDCFSTTSTAISNFSVDWITRGTSLCWWDPFNLSTPDNCAKFEDQLDGMQLEVTLKSTSPSAEHPADGCITDLPNYADGLGEFDCAVLKNDQINADPNLDPKTAAGLAALSGQFTGRTSIKGTVYAPSDAVDFSDSFAEYPLFQRGIIARHLRIESYKYIGSYTTSSSCNPGSPCEPMAHAADIDPNLILAPRTAKFTACVQVAAGDQNKCSAAEGDQILGTADVKFSVTPDANPTTAGNQPAANRPEVLSWQNSR